MPQYHGMYLNYRRPKKATQATKLIEQRSPEGPTPNLNRGFRPNYPPAMTGAAPSPTHFGFNSGASTTPRTSAFSFDRGTQDEDEYLKGLSRGKLQARSAYDRGLGKGPTDVDPYTSRAFSPPGVPNLESSPIEEGAKQPFDWNRLAYVLGDIGQATMGRFQDRWQAQLGGGVKKLSQAQAYKKAMARALSGDRLDPNEFTILSPEQRAEINSLQTENEKLNLERKKASNDYRLKLRKQEFDEDAIEKEVKRFEVSMGWAEKEKDIDVSERAKDRALTSEITTDQIASREKIAAASNAVAQMNAKSLKLHRETIGKDPTDDPEFLDYFDSAAEAMGMIAGPDMTEAGKLKIMATFLRLKGFNKEADMIEKSVSEEPPSGATGVSDTINKYTGKGSSGAGGIF